MSLLRTSPPSWSPDDLLRNLSLIWPCFSLTMTTPSIWPLSCSQATEIAFFLPFLLPILPHAYIFYTTAEWLFLRWIRSLPCIILRCLHIASVPEREPVTTAFEALSHLPSPASLLSAPTVLPQNPCSSSQISQSWEQSEAFPTSEVCVLASSASNTIPAPSAPDRDSPFRSQLCLASPDHSTALSTPSPHPQTKYVLLLFSLKVPNSSPSLSLTRMNNYIIYLFLFLRSYISPTRL